MPDDRYANPPRLPEGEVVAVADLLPPGTKPLLEIGSGRGLFGVTYLSAPETRLVALEVRRKYACLLDEKFRARAPGRARCFAEDARIALPRLAPDGAFAGVVVHFPDPWWKKKHRKRLVVGTGVVDEFARLVAPGGLVVVQTDVPERAEAYLALLRACASLANAAGEGKDFADESPFAPARSNREVRAIADGLPIYRMVFRRV